MTEKQIKQIIEVLKENLLPMIRYLLKCEPDRYSDLLSYIYDHMDITKDELGLVLDSLIENK